MCPVRRATGHNRIENRHPIYTGIGARRTPEPTLELMRQLGQELSGRGWLLRSGGSPGADSAFEQGCDAGHGAKEIFLPWPGFNGSDSDLSEIPPEAFAIASRIHPSLPSRSWPIRRLRSRNVCQILGPRLDDPSDLVIAWTEGGELSGGSATVLQIAGERGIPVINLGARDYANAAFEQLLATVLDAIRPQV